MMQKIWCGTTYFYAAPPLTRFAHHLPFQRGAQKGVQCNTSSGSQEIGNTSDSALQTR